MTTYQFYYFCGRECSISFTLRYLIPKEIEPNIAKHNNTSRQDARPSEGKTQTRQPLTMRSSFVFDKGTLHSIHTVSPVYLHLHPVVPIEMTKLTKQRLRIAQGCHVLAAPLPIFEHRTRAGIRRIIINSVRVTHRLNW